MKTTFFNKHSNFGILLLLVLFTCPSFQGQTLRTLRADGTKIETTSNQEVILRGVNLGQWLVMEGFMMGQDGGMSQSDVKRYLSTNGKSRSTIEYYFDQYRANFITKSDIDYIASKGFNCIRLPLHYELFLTDAQREERLDVIYASSSTKEAEYNDYKTKLQSWVDSSQLAVSPSVDGFQIIDNIVSWCKSNNIYIILDMHTVPGTVGDGENITDELFTGRDFFYDGKNRNALYRIWDKISERYRYEPTICMYDLINEPHRKPTGSLEDLTYTEMTQLKNSYNQLINSIRSNGDDTLILIQGGDYGNDYYSSGVSIYPTSFTNSSNLVFNIHRYRANNSTTATNTDTKNLVVFGEAVNFRNTYNVPLFCGETGLDNDYARLASNFDAMDQLGIGWTLWSYKSHTDRYDPTYDDDRFLLDVGGSNPSESVTIWSNGSLFSNIQFANCSKNPQADFWEAIAPKYPIVSGRTYKILNYNSDKALDISNGSTSNGANAQQFDYSGWNRQLWNVTYGAGTSGWSLINVNSGKALEISASSTSNGGNAQQWTNYNNNNQKWWIEWISDGYGYKIENKNSNRLLEVASSSLNNYANVQQYGTTWFSNNRRWIFVPMFTTSASTAKTLSSKTEETEEITKIDFYPNPVENIINFKLPSNEYTKVNIFSISGSLLKTVSVEGNNLSIDLSDLSQGTYFATFEGIDNKTIPFIKK